ncbi:hypothetical protein [Mycobacteroides abscessus]
MISEAIPTIFAALGFVALAVSLWQSRSLDADDCVDLRMQLGPEQRKAIDEAHPGWRWPGQRPNARSIRRLSIVAALLYLVAAMLQAVAEHGVHSGITSTWTGYFLAMIVAFVNAVVITRRSFPRPRRTAAPLEPHDSPAQWARKCNDVIEQARFLLGASSDHQAQGVGEFFANQVQSIVQRREAPLDGQDRKMLRLFLSNIRYAVITSRIQAAENESSMSSSDWKLTAATLSAIAQLSEDITTIIAELDALTL